MLKRYRIELFIVLGIHLGFLIFQLFSQNYLPDDSLEYIHTTDNIIHEGILYSGDYTADLDPALYSKIMPGYPFFLLISRLLTKSFIPIIIMQLLISMLSVYLMLFIFKPSRASRFLLLPFLIFFPGQYIYPNLITPEIVLQIVLMLATLMVFKHIFTERIRSLWYYQALIILAILIKPEYYLFAFPNVLLFAIIYFKSKQRLVVISSLIVFIFIIIWAGINQKRTGYFHISSAQQFKKIERIHSFIDNNEIISSSDSKKIISDECLNEVDLVKRWKCLSRTSIQLFKDNTVNYLLFRTSSVIHFYIDPGKEDLQNYFGRWLLPTETNQNSSTKNIDSLNPETKQPFIFSIFLVLIVIFNILRFAGFIAYLFNSSVKIEFRLYLFFLIGLISILSIQNGSSQYVLPLILLLTGSAVYQYSKWFDSLRRAKTDS